jgi:hypothetical protein
MFRRTGHSNPGESRTSFPSQKHLKSGIILRRVVCQVGILFEGGATVPVLWETALLFGNLGIDFFGEEAHEDGVEDTLGFLE